MRLRDRAAARVRYGYRRLHVLLQREGWRVNHKRVYRLYRLEGLGLRLKRTRKRVSAVRVVPPRAQKPNERWSMDFMTDSLYDGRRFRLLTIVDTVTRESPAIVVDRSLTGQRVVAALEQLQATRGLPQRIAVDTGPEFISKALDAWAHRTGCSWSSVARGRPRILPAARRSTGGCGRRASISTGSRRLTTHGPSSKPGARRIMPSGHMGRSATLHRRPSLPSGVLRQPHQYVRNSQLDWRPLGARETRFSDILHGPRKGCSSY
jgi:putative transposase